MKKIITVILVCILLCSTFIISSYAAVKEETSIMPLWDNIAIADVDMGFSGTAGTACGTMTKQDGVTFSEGTVFVYKKVGSEWVYVADAYNSTSRYTLAVTCDFTAESGVEYKAVFSVTAYRGEVGESHVAEAYNTCD